MNLFNIFFGRRNKAPSPNEIPEIAPNSSPDTIILSFQDRIQKLIKWEELHDVEFAMWLPSVEDQFFGASPIVAKWTIVYSITKNYWSYISTGLFLMLGLENEKGTRTTLPEEALAFVVLTDTDEQVILSVSKEKGIRFHFAATTPFEYKMAFMDHFIAYCKAWKDLIDMNKEPQDEEPGFAGWWSEVVTISKRIELDEPVQGVGKIVK